MNKLKPILLLIIALAFAWNILQSNPSLLGSGIRLPISIPGVATCVYNSGSPDAYEAPCRPLPPVTSQQSTNPEVRASLLRAGQIENILRGQP